MHTVLVVLHVLVCFFLMVVVLLQRGKGAEMGAVFGGGASSTVFGGRGAGNFLTKLTTGSAIVFMCTSLMLSYIATTRSGERLFENGAKEEPLDKGVFDDLGTAPPEKAAEAGGTQTTPPAGEAKGAGAEQAPTPESGGTPK
jgi:preprotein translocase subunit SecG